MSLPDTSVVYFSSAMSGAPAVSGTAGTLIAVLDACLVNGFGTVTVNSLAVASNVATLVVSTGHNLAMFGSTGPVIEIAGATPAALNGRWRVASVPNATTLTFAVEGIADQTATGTITVKRASAGWAKPFSGTNKAAYARTALGATAMLLRVDDTPAQYPVLTMYESMSDIDTGIGSSGNWYTAKSSAASTAARAWRVFADDRLIHVFADSQANANWSSGFLFGDGASLTGADAYFCMLWAHSAASVSSHPLVGATSQKKRICRSYTQLGSAIDCYYDAGYPNGTSLGLNGLTGLNPVDNALFIKLVEVWEGSALTALRGTMPGIWAPSMRMLALTNGGVYSNFSGLPGRDFVAQMLATTTYGAMIDITGPWRE